MKTYSVVGEPREYQQYETSSCVIPAIIIHDTLSYESLIAVGVPTYTDEGEECTNYIVQSLGYRTLPDLSVPQNWYKSKNDFCIDVLEEVWQDWKMNYSPEDSLDMSDYISFQSGHKEYKEQVFSVMSLLKQYLTMENSNYLIL